MQSENNPSRRIITNPQPGTSRMTEREPGEVIDDDCIMVVDLPINYITIPSPPNNCIPPPTILYEFNLENNQTNEAEGTNLKQRQQGYLIEHLEQQIQLLQNKVIQLEEQLPTDVVIKTKRQENLQAAHRQKQLKIIALEQEEANLKNDVEITNRKIKNILHEKWIIMDKPNKKLKTEYNKYLFDVGLRTPLPEINYEKLDDDTLKNMVKDAQNEIINRRKRKELNARLKNYNAMKKNKKQK